MLNFCFSSLHLTLGTQTSPVTRLLVSDLRSRRICTGFTRAFWKILFCQLYKAFFPEWPKIGKGWWLQLEHREVPCSVMQEVYRWLHKARITLHTFWIPVQSFNINPLLHLISQNNCELILWFWIFLFSPRTGGRKHQRHNTLLGSENCIMS